MDSNKGYTDITERKIQKLQSLLDKGWSRPRFPKRYINGLLVTEEEYDEYMEEQRIQDAIHEAEIASDMRCTSTGEEWEIDSDGEYTPDWLYDRL